MYGLMTHLQGCEQCLGVQDSRAATVGSWLRIQGLRGFRGPGWDLCWIVSYLFLAASFFSATGRNVLGDLPQYQVMQRSTSIRV